MPRGSHLTREFQQMARSHVKPESLSKSGKAGYDALCNKGKAKLAGRKAAEWRLAHPTSLEQVVIGWLDEFKVSYRREVEIDCFFADFVIGKLVVEVNGAQWHEREELRQGQRQRDKRKYQTFSELGYTVLILPESEIKNGQAKITLKNILPEELDF